MYIVYIKVYFLKRENKKCTEESLIVLFLLMDK